MGEGQSSEPLIQCARTVCLSVLITVGDEDKRSLVTFSNTEFQTGSYLPRFNPCPRPFRRRLKHWVPRLSAQLTRWDTAMQSRLGALSFVQASRCGLQLA